MVYTIIRKRNIFHILGNLPTDRATIQRSVAGGGMRLPHQLSGGHRDFQQHQQPSEKQARYHQQQRSTMDPPSKRANSTEAKSVGDLTVPCGTVNSPTDSDGPDGGSSAASAGNAIKSSSEESQHDHDCKQVATLAATPS